ncbi:MAG: hypothetical protein FJW31_16785 [Acidobacteria bacterium]|nr:hypothetical protein [Acidobacteriota bacterium]
MVRTVLILFGALIAITLLRSSIGMLGKVFQQMTTASAESASHPNTVEMVKCPSCGSVFAPQVAQKHTHAGKS